MNACLSIFFPQVPRATPHPSFNEPLHLKIPHPAAVLEIDVLEEDVTGEIATVRPHPPSPESGKSAPGPRAANDPTGRQVPYASCEIPIAQLKDGESKEAWSTPPLCRENTLTYYMPFPS